MEERLQLTRQRHQVKNKKRAKRFSFFYLSNITSMINVINATTIKTASGIHNGDVTQNQDHVPTTPTLHTLSTKNTIKSNELKEIPLFTVTFLLSLLILYDFFINIKDYNEKSRDS